MDHQWSVVFETDTSKQLRELYHVVVALKEQSGFKWDEKKGADIKLESESVWAAYIKVGPIQSSAEALIDVAVGTSKGITIPLTRLAPSREHVYSYADNCKGCQCISGKPRPLCRAARACMHRLT